MKIGFIGTGQITKAVVTGILRSKLKINNIYLSDRNKKISKYLKSKSKKIKILKDNQEIINKSSWIFLAVTPNIGNKILHKYRYKKNQNVVSFISTINFKQLKKIIKVKVNLARAIPLPPISIKKGPIPIFPPNNKIKNFFKHLGTVIELKNETLSLNFWSTSGMMAPYYEFLNTMCNWLIKKGIKKNAAQKYVTSLFLALSEDALIKSNKDLKYLVKESQTPGGLNEQGVKSLKKIKFYNSINITLGSILRRLKS